MIPPMSRTAPRIVARGPPIGPTIFGIVAVGTILLGAIAWSQEAVEAEATRGKRRP